MLACTPHPGFGSVSLRQGAHVRVVDLASCRSHTIRAGKSAPSLPGVSGDRWTIRVAGRTVYVDRNRLDSVEPIAFTPDRRWLLFAIDPQNSASLAADGLTLQAVSVDGGKPHVVASGLLRDDYRTWCGGKLVLTAGGDRIAAHHKWLVVTGPPDWQTRTLLRIPGRAFGSLTCDRGSIVVETTRDLGVNMNLHPRWSLWRVTLDGKATPLDTPPRGASDESPLAGRDGKLLYVRTDGVHGSLYAFGIGPLLTLGAAQSFYGEYNWWQSMSWSLAPRP